MRPREERLAEKLNADLLAFDAQKRPLPGIKSAANRAALVEQLVESIRRVRYVSVVQGKSGISKLRADPSSELFDPLRAAMWQMQQGNMDEAFWLVFLFVHFGKNRKTGWRLARDVYGSLGGKPWTWSRVSSHPKDFRDWLKKNYRMLKGSFGNHRKYESLKPASKGTGAVVESYVQWIGPTRSHLTLIQQAAAAGGGNPRSAFAYLYDSMEKVIRFGRTARFDYLAMIGKLGLAAIEPGSAYMQGATGPLKGAHLLFGKQSSSARVLDGYLVDLDAHLSLHFGMQVLEDALCNWQKSPGVFKPFRG